MYFKLRIIVAVLMLIGNAASFVVPVSSSRRAGANAGIASNKVTTTVKDSISKENWTYNPFDVNDLSPLDTLLRRGVVPLGIRLLRPQKYEDAVIEFMRKEGCDRPTAQRQMDAFFNDPNGWVVSYGRARDLGEDFGDINAPTGVQKRPVFSFFWGTFCFWLFFSFFPTRIAELGGVQPSLPSDGFCKIPIRAEDGTLKCPKFDDYAIEALKRQD